MSHNVIQRPTIGARRHIRRAVGVDAGAAKRPQHPVLQGAASDALTVGAHK
jgi:hypothetical protein